jgi:hypothetical protein
MKDPFLFVVRMTLRTDYPDRNLRNIPQFPVSFPFSLQKSLQFSLVKRDSCIFLNQKHNIKKV